MAYIVRLSDRAFDDIDAITAYIQADSLRNASHWRSGLFEKMATLDFSPRGCSLAPESYYAPFEIRQTLFGHYRILFRVDDDENDVTVLTVRHSARKLLSADDLFEIE